MLFWPTNKNFKPPEEFPFHLRPKTKDPSDDLPLRHRQVVDKHRRGHWSKYPNLLGWQGWKGTATLYMGWPSLPIGLWVQNGSKAQHVPRSRCWPTYINVWGTVCLNAILEASRKVKKLLYKTGIFGHSHVSSFQHAQVESSHSLDTWSIQI